MVLTARLRPALERLNPTLDTEAIRLAIEELTRDRSAMSPAQANRAVYQLLKNGVKVTIAGTKEGGTPKAESIEVDDNGKTTRAESIDKLPKEYQDLAKTAMKAVK